MYCSLQDQSHIPSLKMIHALRLFLPALRELLQSPWEQFDKLTDSNNLLPQKVQDHGDHPYTCSDVCSSLQKGRLFFIKEAENSSWPLFTLFLLGLFSVVA